MEFLIQACVRGISIDGPGRPVRSRSASTQNFSANHASGAEVRRRGVGGVLLGSACQLGLLPWLCRAGVVPSGFRAPLVNGPIAGPAAACRTSLTRPSRDRYGHDGLDGYRKDALSRSSGARAAGPVRLGLRSHRTSASSRRVSRCRNPLPVDGRCRDICRDAPWQTFRRRWSRDDQTGVRDSCLVRPCAPEGVLFRFLVTQRPRRWPR